MQQDTLKQTAKYITDYYFQPDAGIIITRAGNRSYAP